MSTIVKLPKLNDLHVHFRQGNEMNVIKYHERYAEHVLAMPNLLNEEGQPAPLLFGYLARQYGEALRAISPNLKVLTTIFLTDHIEPGHIRDAHSMGVTAAKVYPKDVTTNSQFGVKNIQNLAECFSIMEEKEMVLCLHGEESHSDPFDAEYDFYYNDNWAWLVDSFPKLRIVAEHISQKQTVEMIDGLPENIAATITAHHLLANRGDMMRHKFNARMYCRPVLKRQRDQEALLEAATSGSPKFFLGSDSAPHDIEKKAALDCCAGCFTSPVLPELLVTAFERAGKLHRLESFACNRGADFYGLPRPEPNALEVVQELSTIPAVCRIEGSRVSRTAFSHPVFWGGQGLSWSCRHA